LNDQVKEDGIGRACSNNWGEEEACMISRGKPERSRPLGKPTSMWVNNIQMDLREIG
jgi:hypothetical protein